eukprot:1194494-Prorocentrum_minimum.AAC.1
MAAALPSSVAVGEYYNSTTSFAFTGHLVPVTARVHPTPQRPIPQSESTTGRRRLRASYRRHLAGGLRADERADGREEGGHTDAKKG